MAALTVGAALTAAVISCSSVPPMGTVAKSVQSPPAHGRFDYQIGGVYRPAATVQIVDRDRSQHPAAHTYGICYINAFQTQTDEAALWQHRSTLLLHRNGRALTDPNWPGEHILDIGTAAKRRAIAAIEYRWIDGCAKAGFSAVEPDNLDTYTRFPALTRADAVTFARLLARRAHADGLAIAQKNTPDLDGAARTRVGFDFAIAEECQVYDECAKYTKIYGTHVIEIEYTDQPKRFYTEACRAQGKRISVIRRDRQVVAKGQPGYSYESC